MINLIYAPQNHMRLLSAKPCGARQKLNISVADILTREYPADLRGRDWKDICKQRTKHRWQCIDGDEYFSRFHPGCCEMDILMGVKDGSRDKILVADCKFKMKGGASIANLRNLPDVCKDIADKYFSAQKNIGAIMPVTKMFVIFNHAVAAVARRYLSRCSKGTNRYCRLSSCFEYECLTIEQFNKIAV